MPPPPPDTSIGASLPTSCGLSPAEGPFPWPRYPGGGIGGMTRLKGMGMFIAATGLGPAPIMPIWSWVWKYMFDGRPANTQGYSERDSSRRRCRQRMRKVEAQSPVLLRSYTEPGMRASLASYMAVLMNRAPYRKMAVMSCSHCKHEPR